MNNYIDTLNEDIKEYYKILSPDFPEWINEYINTPVMLKQSKISVSCGTFYSNLFGKLYWYSSLDHSIAVALIIWNFTHDKKQTLSGLFHDISTPAFKHAIDFLNGDYINQESTEELTEHLIANSNEIMTLLNRDNISLKEVSDYHIYPIADNDTPKLSADRLEYTLSNSYGVRLKLSNLEDIKRIYNDISIMKNDESEVELGFNTLSIAEEFEKRMSLLSNSYIDNKTKLSMQFIADVLKILIEENTLTKEDLYKFSEEEIINLILSNNKVNSQFKTWQKLDTILESEEQLPNLYGASIKAKIRYINPLVKISEGSFERISNVSVTAKECIEKATNYTTPKYGYFNFKL